MKQYVSKYVQCPFYHKEDQVRLFCEGVEEGSTIQLSFGNGEQRRGYKRRFCECRNWKHCPIAKMLVEKYE